MSTIDLKTFPVDGTAQSNSAQPARTASTQLGQEQFLSLMVAQLKNQDPLQPMQNGEFLGQMAQFGTVSGIQDLQKSFGSLATALQSNQALMASSLVGRSVLVPGDHVVFNGSQAMGAAELTQAASDVRVSVLDSSGQIVNQFSLGTQAAGLVRFSWNGQTGAGTPAPAGAYTIKVDAMSGGKNSALPTYVASRVDSVSLGGTQGLILNLWDGSTASLANVKEIA